MSTHNTCFHDEKKNISNFWLKNSALSGAKHNIYFYGEIREKYS